MYVIFLQSTYCVKKTSTVSCTLLCESGDRVKVDQSSFSADLHAVMLRHHCSEYGTKGAAILNTLCSDDVTYPDHVVLLHVGEWSIRIPKSDVTLP